MKALLHNIKVILIIFTLIFISLIAGLVVQENRSRHELLAAAGENKQALASRYSLAGSIYSADGVTLAQSTGDGRVYAEDPEIAASCLQLVGDYTHNIANTIESEYQGYLLGNDRPFIPQLLADLRGQGLDGDHVTLTLNAELNKSVLAEMGDRRGAVVLLNYRTGAVLASVSTPTTTPDRVIAYEDIPDSALYNRVLLGAYAPGSTFKMVTAAAWMTDRDFDPDYTVDCLGPQPLIEPDGVKEEHEDGHGPVDLKTAMQVSCNYFFGDVGVRTGREGLLETARRFGFGRKFALDRLGVSTSAIDIPDRDSTLSWISIGQPVADSRLMLTPLQMAMTVGAIANDGVMLQPHIVDHMTSPQGSDYEFRKAEQLTAACPPDTAGAIRELLVDAVESGSGSGAAVAGYRVGGKTGTAEVEGQEAANALFLGFVESDVHPYAIAVVCENAGYGSAEAAPIAAAVLRRAIELRVS